MSDSVRPRISTKEYFVIWIDILGYTDRIKSRPEEVDDFLNKIDEAFEISLKFNYKMSSVNKRIKMKTFSDNVLLYTETRNDAYAYLDLDAILSSAAFIQTSMMIEFGLLVRGATAIGKFFANNRIVYGPALIDAYHYERLSPGPIITIQKNELDYIRQNDVRASQFKLPPLSDYILECKGVHFIDYIKVYGEKIKSNDNAIKSHKETIEGIYRNYLTSWNNTTEDADKINQKYAWILEYHNEYVERFGNKESLRIDYEILNDEGGRKKISINKNCLSDVELK